ncbi:Eco57I restriction-modification methylase domain-containing protein [Labilibaculum antarcticum]|uniref:site-specific DNA-methyltransferase (adenine-specific) n=1 Tax=Labilibaculum antarcticum TaxID=1717717 RepID=A0A1Y1CPJ5_9BACT|nr:hypothetical protein [Labilibaculum antarcticum]BAX82356.1 hypothetical protein ALGA_4065 [Labilibaculum antarcticum]
MIRFIKNIGDYFSQHFFNDEFPTKVFNRAGFVTTQKDNDGNDLENHISSINKKVSPLSEKYFRFKNDYLNLHREKDRVKLTHDFHTEVLKVLGYLGVHQEYEYPIHLNEDEVIPVRYRFTKADKPYLYVMEMKAMIQEGEHDANGIYDQVYNLDDWQDVFPDTWENYALKPDVINEALSEMFLLPEEQRPQYVILLAGPKLFLIHYEKWKYDSFLLFDLEELFDEAKLPAFKNYLSLFYGLLAKDQFISDSDSILHTLEEDAHKAAYGVTQTLKKGVVYAVENLANEAIEYKLRKAANSIEEQRKIVELRKDPNFARELKDECLTIVYRLLFIFYAEAREDLEILPVKDAVYQKGYSLEMLRDLEMVELKTDSSRNGTFFSESLWKLFDFLHKGSPAGNGFEMKPLDSPMFDNTKLQHLSGVQFRNHVLKEIILRLSLSERTKNKSIGRISYANLGINQLGSVYESLLAYSGFFANENLIEVKAASDKTGKEGTFLVPKSRRDDFKENEILKDPEHPDQDAEIERGKFVYRLNGRDRKKSASYYTPEVLTQCTVKYTLKGIVDKLKEKQNIIDGVFHGEYCADEILKLKILEPAMGAAAFHNEVINQLAVTYLELKENEELHKGRKRITPGNYNDELQKVKAFIAANNVYGVDLNPTAVELGKLSLWLNCMHKDMETPFFAHRLATGNAVVGAWLKVYEVKDFNTEFPSEGTLSQRNKPIAKAWWTKAPKRVQWNKQGKLNRNVDKQVYHFLLPDKAMVASFNSQLLKEELTKAQKDKFTTWKHEFCSPLNGEEVKQVVKLSRLIDVLLEEHYQKITAIAHDTASHYQLYGDSSPKLALKNYADKERLTDSKNNRAGAYHKLRTIMDYWCALWFWDVRDVENLPDRTKWYNELTNLVGIKLSDIDENTSTDQIKYILQNQGANKLTLFEGNRIASVLEMRNQYRFFHNELEFIEVFKERGGFDVIVGNPPWVTIELDKTGILSEYYPEVFLRKYSAPKVSDLLLKEIELLPKLKISYSKEELWAISTKTFLGSKQCYQLLRGQRTDLYKSILVNCIDFININGYVGLIHPESIYDDPKGTNLRREVYKRLKYHFQFKNERMLFPEIDHHNAYSTHVYKGKKEDVGFISINNLFHPSTIDGSFIHDGHGMAGGYKTIDEQTGKMDWNIRSHKDRIIKFGENELRLLAQTFENSSKWEGAKLVSIHTRQILSVLEKLSIFNGKVEDSKYHITDCWNETIAVQDGIMIRNTQFPDIDKYELIYSGPHFFVATPLYKTPRSECKLNSDYDAIDLTMIEGNFIPRTNYIPDENLNNFCDRNKSNNIVKSWIHEYKVCFSKMLSISGERTLQPAIIPPKVSHIDGVVTIIFKTNKELIEFAGISSSLMMDFYIKSVGKSNLRGELIKKFPIGIDNYFIPQLFVRTLLLNCLNEHYTVLWCQNYQSEFSLDNWSKTDIRLKPFNKLTQDWQWDTPLRNYFERRQALVEIDVITAMAFGLTLDELILIYNVQFPVLQQNEADTWYDTRGNIVFTFSSGLTGVGLARNEWNKIKDLAAGETYEHTITKSELYKGEKQTYYAPFDKCDRVEDYKTAWAHFEKVFKEKE